MDEMTIEEFERMVQARADLDAEAEVSDMEEEYLEQPFDFLGEPESEEQEISRMVEAFLKCHPVEEARQ